MDKRQLIDYLELKREALDFWEELMPEVDFPQKRALLRSEIAEAEAELKKVRDKESGNLKNSKRNN